MNGTTKIATARACTQGPDQRTSGAAPRVSASCLFSAADIPSVPPWTLAGDVPSPTPADDRRGCSPLIPVAPHLTRCSPGALEPRRSPAKRAS